MKDTINIRGRALGPEHPLFVTAEVGVTCNYDLGLSKELIDVVRESGADAAKFIFWFPDEIMSDRTISYSYETTEGTFTENMFEMLEGLRFTLDEWHELKSYADERDVVLFATVNSPSGIQYAEAIGLEAYKLSSWDYNYLPLWRRIAELGKPMLIDTGPVNTLEVAKVMQVLKEAGNDQSVLVHTVHTDDPAQINMRAIPYMAKAFRTLVGYSSAAQDSETDVLSIALGSVYLEKRLTMRRDLPGHHHVLSLEPDEFADYVRRMRDAKAALGVEDLVPSEGDLSERRRWFRHLVADRDIPAGTVLTAEMLEGKRPESGISPEHIDFFVGRRVTRELVRNEAISFEDV